MIYIVVEGEKEECEGKKIGLRWIRQWQGEKSEKEGKKMLSTTYEQAHKSDVYIAQNM